MKKHISQSLLLMVMLSAFMIPSFGQEEDDALWAEVQEIAIIEQKVMMPMRDGIRLATDIYRPKTDKPVPVIFSRTPYNFNLYAEGELN